MTEADIELTFKTTDVNRGSRAATLAELRQDFRVNDAGDEVHFAQDVLAIITIGIVVKVGGDVSVAVIKNLSRGLWRYARRAPGVVLPRVRYSVLFSDGQRSKAMQVTADSNEQLDAELLALAERFNHAGTNEDDGLEEQTQAWLRDLPSDGRMHWRGLMDAFAAHQRQQQGEALSAKESDEGNHP